MAMQIKSAGHFDKVIASIDEMIVTLRKEEADDIAHKDRCEMAQGKNKNDKEDLEHNKKKAGEEIGRMGDNAKTLKDKVDALKEEIKKGNEEMDDLLEIRNRETADFKQALKDDMAAVQLLEM